MAAERGLPVATQGREPGDLLRRRQRLSRLHAALCRRHRARRATAGADPRRVRRAGWRARGAGVLHRRPAQGPGHLLARAAARPAAGRRAATRVDRRRRRAARRDGVHCARDDLDIGHARPPGRSPRWSRLRYKAPPAPATVTPLGDGRAEVRCDEPLRAITPGQAAVFYGGPEGDEALGGGLIETDPSRQRASGVRRGPRRRNRRRRGAARYNGPGVTTALSPCTHRRRRLMYSRSSP